MGTNQGTHDPIKKPINESRRIYWILMAISLVVIAVSGSLLGKRISSYMQTVDHPLFAYIQVASTSFTFGGRPITLREETIDGQDVVRVTYGDQELILDVTIPSQQPLPTLFDRQTNWLTMNFFADRSGMELKAFELKIEDDEIKPRLAIVTRTPLGVEPRKAPRFKNLKQPENWGTGEVRRDRWRFDCYEFLRDGTIKHEVKRFPESGRSLQYRQNYAKLRGQEIPQRDEGELEEYSWERGAALKIMPRPPAITFEEQPLRGAGWTLPATAAGFLMLIVSFFFAIAPNRVTRSDQ